MKASRTAQFARAASKAQQSDAGQALRFFVTQTFLFQEASNRAVIDYYLEGAGDITVGAMLHLMKREEQAIINSPVEYAGLPLIDREFAALFRRADLASRRLSVIKTRAPEIEKNEEALRLANQTLQYHFSKWRAAYLDAAGLYEDLMGFYEAVRREEEAGHFQDLSLKAQNMPLMLEIIEKRSALYNELRARTKNCDNRAVDLDEGLSVLCAAFSRTADILESKAALAKPQQKLQKPIVGLN